MLANSFAADDLEFLHAQKEATPGAFSVVKVKKHALPTTGMVHRVIVYHDYIDGTLSRQIGLHLYDLGMEKRIYAKLTECEVIKYIPHALPPVFERFQIPPELNWMRGSETSRTAGIFFATDKAIT